jgi:hypothetical protein
MRQTVVIHIKKSLHNKTGQAIAITAIYATEYMVFVYLTINFCIKNNVRWRYFVKFNQDITRVAAVTCVTEQIIWLA